MTCECFDVRVALAATYKGFKDAHRFGDTPLVGGLKAIGHTFEDIRSRGREIKNPTDAYFMTKLERKINPRAGRDELFWEGHNRSIRESMRRRVAWLRLHKAGPEEIAQAKLEYSDWVQSERTILESNGGMPVRFFSSRDGDATQGMAFHQVSSQNGELILESQLLPFGRVEQIETLRDLVGNMREPINFRQDLPGMIQESLSVNQEVGVPIHVMEGVNGGAGLGIGISDVHLGGVLEEAEVIKPLEIAVIETPKYGEISVSQPHFGSGVAVESVVESVVMGAMEEVLGGQVAEHKSVIGVKVTQGQKEATGEISLSKNEPQVSIVVPTVTGTVLVSEEVMESKVLVPSFTELPRYGEVKVVEPQVIAPVQQEVVVMDEKGITEDTEVIESTEEISVTANDSVPSVIKEVSVEEVHLGGVLETDRMEEAIAESTEVIEGTENSMIFNGVNGVSVPVVIKETFNEPVEYQEHKSVKAKIVWLSRSIANVVADGLMGRWWKLKQAKPILAWLVYGMALIQFDSVDKSRFDGVVSGQMSQWRLSPVRVWADRVVRRAKRVKDEIVQVGWGVYKQLFANI